MIVVRLLPVIISTLLLAAHFSRAELPFLALIILLFPAILFLKRGWVARLTQCVLVLGAMEWVRITLVYVAERREAGESWVRLAAIIGGVAVFTLVSALIFSRSGTLRKRYRLE